MNSASLGVHVCERMSAHPQFLPLAAKARARACMRLARDTSGPCDPSVYPSLSPPPIRSVNAPESFQIPRRRSSRAIAGHFPTGPGAPGQVHSANREASAGATAQHSRADWAPPCVSGHTMALTERDGTASGTAHRARAARTHARTHARTLGRSEARTLTSALRSASTLSPEKSSPNCRFVMSSLTSPFRFFAGLLAIPPPPSPLTPGWNSV